MNEKLLSLSKLAIKNNPFSFIRFTGSDLQTHCLEQLFPNVFSVSRWTEGKKQYASLLFKTKKTQGKFTLPINICFRQGETNEDAIFFLSDEFFREKALKLPGSEKELFQKATFINVVRYFDFPLENKKDFFEFGNYWQEISFTKTTVDSVISLHLPVKKELKVSLTKKTIEFNHSTGDSKKTLSEPIEWNERQLLVINDEKMELCEREQLFFFSKLEPCAPMPGQFIVLKEDVSSFLYQIDKGSVVQIISVTGETMTVQCLIGPGLFAETRSVQLTGVDVSIISEQFALVHR